MTKFICTLGLLSGMLLCLSNCGDHRASPASGIELSSDPNISLIRVASPGAAVVTAAADATALTPVTTTGSGSFELNAAHHYELSASKLDLVSLIELIAPNYRVSMRAARPSGRYDFNMHCQAFANDNPLLERVTLQQAAFHEIEHIFHLHIDMDMAKRHIIITN